MSFLQLSRGVLHRSITRCELPWAPEGRSTEGPRSTNAPGMVNSDGSEDLAMLLEGPGDQNKLLGHSASLWANGASFEFRPRKHSTTKTWTEALNHFHVWKPKQPETHEIRSCSIMALEILYTWLGLGTGDGTGFPGQSEFLEDQLLVFRFGHGVGVGKTGPTR